MNSKDKRSFLKVNPGIEQPSSINNPAVEKIHSKRKPKLSIDDYIKGILAGDRTILSQAITLVESTLPKHYDTAQEILEKCLPYGGKSLRVGITGVPGVGKSTFIEALGKHILSQNSKLITHNSKLKTPHMLAVLAIDPSSKISKGSILGDKTRMEMLSVDPDAFIRPSPTAGSLGGVARKTREIIILCEAAGFDIIFIETVGVGQSEVIVHSMVDYFLLLMLAGAGDELQGIKRGIMEMADAIVINKADGDNLIKANVSKTEYENALHLFPLPESGWKPEVDTCSSITKKGIDKVWETIMKYYDFTLKNGYFHKNRNRQVEYMMKDFINHELLEHFYDNDTIKKLIPLLEKDILSNKITSYTAARQLLDIYFKGLKK
jgi:LAO/AO transport system kinase